MTQVAELTGAQVREWREAHKLSRREFAELCGFPTQTRVFNIETKDSWKGGDREAVAAAMNQAAHLPTRKRSHSKKEAEDRVNALEDRLRASGKLIRELPDPDTVPDEITVSLEDDDEPDPQSAAWVEPDQAANEGTLTFADDDTDESDCTYPDFDVVNDVELTEDDESSTPVAQPDAWDELVNSTGPDEKLLTNSEVSVWTRCRRKWWFAFYRQLVYGQIDYSGPREIGNRVHRALAAYYVPEGVEPKDPRVALQEAIADDWAKIEKSIRDFGVQGDLEQVLADRAATYNAACELEKAMIEGYVDWLQETASDANLRITEPESIIHAKVEGEVLGEKIEFTALGKLDARARRASDGVRLFVDHKTTGSFTEPRKTLHMDAQMLHYHLLEFLNSSEGDERCDAALYNMLRKVKRGPSAKPPFYERLEVHHNPMEIESYRERLIGAARDIMRTTRELDAGANPLNVVYPTPTKNCAWDCDFFFICPMVDDGSRVEDAISNLYHVGDPLARYAKDQEIGGI